jgi:hypothetical protein
VGALGLVEDLDHAGGAVGVGGVDALRHFLEEGVGALVLGGLVEAGIF